MTLEECFVYLDDELNRVLEDNERIHLLQMRLWLTELKVYRTNEFPKTASLDIVISNLEKAEDEVSKQLSKRLKELKEYRVSCK